MKYFVVMMMVVLGCFSTGCDDRDGDGNERASRATYIEIDATNVYTPVRHRRFSILSYSDVREIRSLLAEDAVYGEENPVIWGTTQTASYWKLGQYKPAGPHLWCRVKLGDVWVNPTKPVTLEYTTVHKPLIVEVNEIWVTKNNPNPEDPSSWGSYELVALNKQKE